MGLTGSPLAPVSPLLPGAPGSPCVGGGRKGAGEDEMRIGVSLLVRRCVLSPEGGALELVHEVGRKRFILTLLPLGPGGPLGP